MTNLIICVTGLDIQGVRTSLNKRTIGDGEGARGASRAY